MRLWFAQIGSAFGSRITRTIVPIMAILLLDATPSQIGILAVLGISPGVAFAVFMGGYIDRSQKQRLLIMTDIVRALAIMIVPLLAWLGLLTIPHLYLVTFIVGVASAVFGIADNTFLPVIVAKEQLVDANAKLKASDSIAEATGPGIAGILVDLITAPFAMIIDAATYIWSAFMLARIKITELPAQPEPKANGMFGDAIIGFRLCMRLPAIRSLLFISALTSFFGGFFMALYMVLGLSVLELSPSVLGIVISMGGVGAFLGALSAKYISRKLGVRRAMLWMLVCGQLSKLLIPASITVPEFGVWLLAASQLLEDGFLTVFAILAISMLQKHVQGDRLGRVNATFYVVNGIVMPISALLAGPLVLWIGFEATIWLASLGGLLAIAAFQIRPTDLSDM